MRSWSDELSVGMNAGLTVSPASVTAFAPSVGISSAGFMPDSISGLAAGIETDPVKIALGLIRGSDHFRSVLTYARSQYSRIRFLPSGGDQLWEKIVTSACETHAGFSAPAKMALLFWLVGSGYYIYSKEGDSLTVRAISPSEATSDKDGNLVAIKLDGAESALGGRKYSYAVSRNVLDSAIKDPGQAKAAIDTLKWFSVVATTDYAIEVSRLSAGVLYVTDKMTTYPFVAGGAPGRALNNSGLAASIMSWLIRPSKSPGSPSSVAPLIIQGPADAKDPIRHILLKREPVSIEMRRAKIEELAFLIDLPARRVTGERGTYSNDWVMAHEEAQRHFQPYADAAASFLRDYLHKYYKQSGGKKGFSDCRITTDIKRLTFGPDREARLLRLFMMGLIDAKTYMEETGDSDIWNGNEKPDFSALGAGGEGRVWGDRIIPSVRSRSRGSEVLDDAHEADWED